MTGAQHIWENCINELAQSYCRVKPTSDVRPPSSIEKTLRPGYLRMWFLKHRHEALIPSVDLPEFDIGAFSSFLGGLEGRFLQCFDGNVSRVNSGETCEFA